jgi:hypothetical protein
VDQPEVTAVALHGRDQTPPIRTRIDSVRSTSLRCPNDPPSPATIRSPRPVDPRLADTTTAPNRFRRARTRSRHRPSRWPTDSAATNRPRRGRCRACLPSRRPWRRDRRSGLMPATPMPTRTQAARPTVSDATVPCPLRRLMEVRRRARLATRFRKPTVPLQRRGSRRHLHHHRRPVRRSRLHHRHQ